MLDIGLAGALIGGILTLLSPCSVMLLPAFFSYAFSNPGQLLARTGIFYLGLTATLVPLGILAGTLGGVVSQNRPLLINIAAIVVIIFGCIQMVGIQLPTFGAQATATGTSPIAVFLLGTVYGLAGACTGPILGSVLTLAAMGGSPLYGGIVLAVFAVGMTIPLLVLSFAWARFTKIQEWLRPRQLVIGKWQNTWTQVIGGALSIGIGVLLIATGGLAVGGILGATDQFRVETWALRETQGISDYAVLIVGGLLVLTIWGIRRVMKRKKMGPSKRNWL